MKFGKRLLAEAARSENLAPFFFDYRAAKRDIDRDVTASGGACARVLLQTFLP